jgi:arylsulfatase A-like enzyme
VAQYDGEIRCTDEYLGRLFGVLRDLGLWENTAIIVTADHGEEFYDHGRNSHKNTLYQESLHVPLIVKPAGKTEPRRDDRLVNLIDLYPTVLDIAGCKPSQPHSGQSLLEAAPDADRPVFFELKTIWTFNRKSTGESWQEIQNWTAVRQGHFKLIHVNDISKPGIPERWELYDLAADPTEKRPLSADHDEVVGRLQAELERWSADMQSMSKLWQPGGQAQLSEEEEGRLRGLGYLP